MPATKRVVTQNLPAFAFVGLNLTQSNDSWTVLALDSKGQNYLFDDARSTADFDVSMADWTVFVQD